MAIKRLYFKKFLLSVTDGNYIFKYQVREKKQIAGSHIKKLMVY